MITTYSPAQMRCVGWVIGIHMTFALLMKTVLTNHTSIVLTFIIALPLMYRVYWGTFEPTSRQRLIKQKFRQCIRKNFLTASGRENLYLDVMYGIMISFGLFLLMLVGQYFFGYELCPNQRAGNSFYFYLLLSVPGQQLLFFIWPQILSENVVPRPISSVASVLWFGHLHSYYPELVTPVLAAVVLGIPSAVLVYYLKNPIAAMICHGIIGSSGILLGLV